MNNKVIWIGGIIVVMLAIGYFLMAGKGIGNNNETSISNDLQIPGKVTIIGNEFSFSPSSVTVKKGDHVILVFENQGSYSHNLTIPDLNLHTNTISKGQTTSLEFTADKVGSFDYVCTVDSHQDKGMIGKLIVQ